MGIALARYEDGQIKGCEIGSPEYYHELGHKVLDDSTHIQYWKGNLLHTVLIVGLISALTRTNIVLSYCLIGLYLLVMLIDELFAWYYCFRHYNEWKNYVKP